MEYAVVSWIWNEDGSASIQRLAIGSYYDCLEFAANAKRVTDDPAEVIGVVPNDELFEDTKERLKGLN